MSRTANPPRQLRLRPSPLCAALVAACAAAAAAQTAPRVVVEVAPLPNLPVELVGVEVAGESHAFAEGPRHWLVASFDVREDWLRSLTLRVRNLSQKPIAFVLIHLSLPEARYQAGGVGIAFRYGSARPGGGAGARAIAPGGEAELRFNGDEYKENRSFAVRLSGMTEFNRVHIDTASVTFTDGTRARVDSPVRAPRAASPAGAK